MEYQRMKYFLETARTGNFSAAAKNLYISPQSVAKQVGLLEEELGVQLFDRIGRNIKINEAGQYAYQRFQTVDTLLEESIQAVKTYGEKGKNVIRMGFFSGLPKKEFILPIINLVITNIPDVELKLEMLDLGEDVRLLMADRLEFVFTNVEDYINMENCNLIEFARKPAKIVVAPGHPWYEKEKITEEELKQGSFIRLQSAKISSGDATRARLYDKVRCTHEIMVPNFNTMYTILEQGKAFAIFPQIFANVDDVDFRYLDIPNLQEKFVTVGIYKSNSNNLYVKKLCELLENNRNTYNI